MISDTERREVARRLRGNPEDTLIPHRTGRHHGMGCREAADRFWNMCDRIKEAGNYDIAFSTTSILADLIEPPARCPHYMHPCCRTDAGGDYIDRDALLALADECENGSKFMRTYKGSDPTCVLMATMLSDEYGKIARRIREALGVADG